MVRRIVRRKSTVVEDPVVVSEPATVAEPLVAEPIVTERVVTEPVVPAVAATTEVVNTVPASSVVTETELLGFKIYQIVYFFLAILEALLAFRFFLRLFGANPNSPFVDFIYDLTYVFVFPFQGIFDTMRADESVFDWGIIVAMIVYLLLGYAFARLIEILTRPAVREI